MAEVLSKTNLFSPCHHGRRAGFSSAFPKKSCNYKPSSSVRWFQPLKLKSHAIRSSSLSSSDFHGRRLVIHANRTIPKRFQPSIYAQTGIRFGKAHKWWEKGLQSNMKEVTSAEDLVSSLLNAGDKLVVVEFFSPGCGGCRALHPKICQLAELNPDVQFLQVNYEEHKSMCYSLNVHVLPFFRFYRGSHGRLCSFSCTNATIKKFKDALSKHTPDRCSLGPTKGLEEKELLALSANKDLSFNYTTKPVQPVVIPAQEAIIAETSPSHLNPVPLDLPARPSKSTQDSKEKPLVSAGR